MNITELLEDEVAYISGCDIKRLMEHGFVPDTPIRIYKKVNGVTSIYLRGGIIACRDENLKTTTVEYTKTKYL